MFNDLRKRTESTTKKSTVQVMPFSHHSHSGQFCKHASGTLESVVLEAIRQNFVVYSLTEHVPRYRLQDLYPEEVCASARSIRCELIEV